MRREQQMMSDNPWLAAADAVLDNLSDRKGIKQALDPIRWSNELVWDEIRQALAVIIRDVVISKEGLDEQTMS